MEIIKAEKAGFCFGVENAVNKAFEILEKNAGKKHVFSYGEIIHNDKVIVQCHVFLFRSSRYQLKESSPDGRLPALCSSSSLLSPVFSPWFLHEV